MSLPTIRAAAVYFNVLPEDVLGTCRESAVINARYAAIYVMRHRDGLSLPIIGKRLGKDHTSILYAARRAELMLDKNEHFAAFVHAQLALPPHSATAATVPAEAAKSEVPKTVRPLAVAIAPARMPAPAPKVERPTKPLRIYRTVQSYGERTMRVDQDGYTRDEQVVKDRMIVGSQKLAKAIKLARAA